MRHIIPISGKDSLATAIIQNRLHPEFDYEYMFNPTGQEPPEVFEWIKRVGEYFGKEINLVGEDLEDLIVDHGYFLPNHNSRYCTREAKIKPMEKWIGKDDCTVYYGIRADEKRDGYNNTRRKNINPKYPLVENNLGINDVYRINSEVGLKPPVFFWESLYKEVIQVIPEDYINANLEEWERDHVFAWRSRTNCSMCYNQRMYEWVGLLEHHPELFKKYQSWESMGDTNYYFIDRKYPLKYIFDNSVGLKRKRVKAVINLIFSIDKASLFGIEAKSDILNIVSCGLFCGK